MFKKLRSHILIVDNLEKAKQWYTGVLQTSPYFDQPFYVGFDVNGFELGLDPDIKGLQKGNQAIAHWQVDNIFDKINLLSEAGAKIIQQPSDVGGNTLMAIFEDPFGNKIGLIQE